MMTQTKRMQVLISIAKEAAQLALSRQMEASGLSVDMKGRLDFVSNADREVEALVATRVAEAFPQDGLFGEEGQRNPGTSGVVWVVDPIDGTHNFVLGGRDWAVSIAVLGPEGRAAAVAIPSADLILSAETGGPLSAERSTLHPPLPHGRTLDVPYWRLDLDAG